MIFDIMDAEKMIEKFELRADQEYDYFVNFGVKIIDNLLLVNSAVIAILISTENKSLFRFPILFLIISSLFALAALYNQKELARISSIKFRSASIMGNNCLQNEKALKPEELPDIVELRKKSEQINYFINISLASFAISFLVILWMIFFG